MMNRSKHEVCQESDGISDAKLLSYAKIRT